MKTRCLVSIIAVLSILVIVIDLDINWKEYNSINGSILAAANFAGAIMIYLLAPNILGKKKQEAGE